MNDMTPTSDGGGGSSSGSTAMTGVGVAKAVEDARLYVDGEELDAFAEVALEHEQVLKSLVEAFAMQRTAMLPGLATLPIPQIETFDAENLKLGDFEEATACSQSFREVVYKGIVTSTNYLGEGQAVCGDVARRTRENYLSTDESIAIDTQSLDREIENAGRGGNTGMSTDFDWDGGSSDE